MAPCVVVRCRQQYELRRLARVEREFGHFFVIDHLADASVMGFHLQRLGLDRNLIAHCAHLSASD